MPSHTLPTGHPALHHIFETIRHAFIVDDLVVCPAGLHDSRNLLLILATVLTVKLSCSVVRRAVWVRIMQQRLQNNILEVTEVSKFKIISNYKTPTK